MTERALSDRELRLACARIAADCLTTAEALMPGAVVDLARALWEFVAGDPPHKDPAQIHAIPGREAADDEPPAAASVG